ncbi:MAG: magnesium transporter [Deltaproteobacteria bacterium]|nr:magnesium transporter [Deltaproteobacteria bacterium]
MKSLELFKPEIKQLIQDQQWNDLKDLLAEFPAPDISDLLEDTDEAKRILILRLLPRGELLSEVFAHMETKLQSDILQALSVEETRLILSELSPDDRTDFLENLPGQAIQKLLTLLSPVDRRESLQLLGYPKETVGRLMTPDYVAVRPEWTIEQAVAHIRATGIKSETIDVIYVTDRSGKLLDALELRRIILAEPQQLIEEIMDYSVVSVPALDDREKAVQLIRHYDLLALPVVDASGVLLGIVTVDDLFDVAEEETTEDFQISAAVEPLKMSYRESSAFSLYSKRIFWLVALLGISIVTTGIIASQEASLTSAIALVFFIPLLIGAGGNTGSQSATLMIRALATGDIREGQLIAAFFREIGIGILLGVTMGLASWFLGFFKGGIQIASIISLAMITIVVISSIIGFALPLLLLRLGMDPAMASNPLISSVMDILGLLIYFSIASLVLNSV